ncbi:MAG: NUDIX hydrolase [Thermomicrobiales bacterium]
MAGKAADAIWQEWVVLRRHELADRRPWLRLWSEDVQLPDGRIVEGFTQLEMPDVAVIVALTPDNRVIVEWNYKHGPRRVCLNLPAGYLEAGEEPLAAARRELLEETGYAADEWVPLGQFANDGNRGAGTSFLFLARGARQIAQPDAGDLEELAIALMPMDELSDAVRNGEVAILTIAAAIGLAVIAHNQAWPAVP